MVEQAALEQRRQKSAVHAHHADLATRERMARMRTVARNMDDERTFAINFARQNSAIGKQIQLSEFRRFRQGVRSAHPCAWQLLVGVGAGAPSNLRLSASRNQTMSAVGARKIQSEARRQQNADLLKLRMVRLRYSHCHSA
jgi:hypothetical protein